MNRFLLIAAFALTACDHPTPTANQRDSQQSQQQMSQYSQGQPVPSYDYSLERDLLIQLYNLRNEKVATHSVWRGDTSIIEGDCKSMGYGLPYDTSLTNPWVAEWRRPYVDTLAGVAVSQPEPNGVYASTNTSATWVFCVGPGGSLEPIYVEAKVTVYPGPVVVDYRNNTVERTGAATAAFSTQR